MAFKMPSDGLAPSVLNIIQGLPGNVKVDMPGTRFDEARSVNTSLSFLGLNTRKMHNKTLNQLGCMKGVGAQLNDGFRWIIGYSWVL